MQPTVTISNIQPTEKQHVFEMALICSGITRQMHELYTSESPYVENEYAFQVEIQNEPNQLYPTAHLHGPDNNHPFWLYVQKQVERYIDYHYMCALQRQCGEHVERTSFTRTLPYIIDDVLFTHYPSLNILIDHMMNMNKQNTYHYVNPLVLTTDDDIVIDVTDIHTFEFESSIITDITFCMQDEPFKRLEASCKANHVASLFEKTRTVRFTKVKDLRERTRFNDDSYHPYWSDLLPTFNTFFHNWQIMQQLNANDPSEYEIAINETAYGMKGRIVLLNEQIVPPVNETNKHI